MTLQYVQSDTLIIHPLESYAWFAFILKPSIPSRQFPTKSLTPKTSSGSQLSLVLTPSSAPPRHSRLHSDRFGFSTSWISSTLLCTAHPPAVDKPATNIHIRPNQKCAVSTATGRGRKGQDPVQCGECVCVCVCVWVCGCVYRSDMMRTIYEAINFKRGVT